MLSPFLTKLKTLVPEKDAGLLLAVSGGVDSMVMLDLFRQSDYRIEVAHCHFQLRGEDSENDMRLVKDYCVKYAIPFHCKRFDTKMVAKDRGISTQMAARDLRYDWFEKLVQECNLSLVATAHHSDDHVETVLLNLVRGTGIEGLKGILSLRNKRLRPLLDFTREQIKAYAIDNEIHWREDSSNLQDDYSRNFLRHKVIPYLKELNPSLNQGFERFSERMGMYASYFQKEYLHFIETYVHESGESVQMSKHIFFDPDFRVFIQRFLEDKGFHFELISRLLSGKDEPGTGAVFEGSDYKLLIDRETVICFPDAEPRNQSFQIDLEEENDIPLSDGFFLKWSAISTMPDITLLKNQSHAFLDREKLTGSFSLRNWQQGDKMRPFGMKGSRLISDMLVDLKMSRLEKSKQLVLCCGTEIIWLVGIRISDRVAVQKSTRQILHFELLKGGE